MVDPLEAKKAREVLREANDGRSPIAGTPSWKEARAALIHGLAIEPVLKRAPVRVEFAPEVSVLLQAFIDNPTADVLNSVVNKLSNLRGEN
jgi:hypothetical protein